MTERVTYFTTLVSLIATEKLNWIVAKSVSFKFSQKNIVVEAIKDKSIIIAPTFVTLFSWTFQDSIILERECYIL